MYHPFLFPLILGFVLDALLGDPNWLPHPIRWFGMAISKAEKQFNKGKYKILKGGLLAAFLILGTWAFFMAIKLLIEPYKVISIIISALVVFWGLANRSLISEALKVENRLQIHGLEPARIQLSYIVGRNTNNLNENQIRTAVLETLAENLSDGVIAPLFYYALGGFPLMMAYKMVNTLDSMIGYKNERYYEFGRFAARFDDFANYLPARITAFLMAIISFSLRAFAFIFKYGRNHSSPNSGYPEAAMAGILNCRFGGPSTYGNQVVEKPFIGNSNRLILHADIIKALFINALTAVVATAIIIAIYLISAS